MNQIRKLMLFPLKAVWKLTGAPVHTRLFGRYFRATLGRLDSALGHLDHVHHGVNEMRPELTELRAELAEIRTAQRRIEERLDGIAATRWDSTALVRRLAAIEDELAERANGNGSGVEAHAADG